MNTIFLREAPSWAMDPVKRHKFERHFDEIPRFVKIESGMKDSARQVISQLQSGAIDKAQAMKRFKADLQHAESQTFVAGRRNRGDLRKDLTEGEVKMLDGRHSRNMKYFSKFCDDVVQGKGRMDYMRRADMYGESLWSIFTRGESSNWEDDTNGYRFMWVLDADAEHCPTCLERAKLSRDKGGFTFDELVEIGFPGEGTICATRCRCHIERMKVGQNTRPKEVPRPEPAPTPTEGLKTLEELMGDTPEPELPAAGVPFVRANQDLIPVSVVTEGKGASTQVIDFQKADTARGIVDQLGALPDPSKAEELLQRLPLVPYTLLQPEKVVNIQNLVTGNPQRVYTGNGLALVTERSGGAWWLVLIMLYDPELFGSILEPMSALIHGGKNAPKR